MVRVLGGRLGQQHGNRRLGISYALGVAALRALGQAEEKLGIDGDGMLDGKPVKVGAILDGPNDYITKR